MDATHSHRTRSRSHSSARGRAASVACILIAAPLLGSALLSHDPSKALQARALRAPTEISRLPAEPAEGTSRFESERLLLVADWPCDALLEALAARMRASLPVIEAGIGHSLPEGEKVVLLLYRESKDMHAVIESHVYELAGQLALVSFLTGEAFVVAQPSVDEDVLAIVGDVPEALESQVLHEVVHQCVFRSHPVEEGFMPRWFYEGRAEYLAQKAMALRTDDLERCAWITSTRNHVARAFREGTHIPLDDLAYLGRSSGEPITPLFYRQSALLYEFLLQDGGEFGERFADFLDWVEDVHGPDCLGRDFIEDWEQQIGKAERAFEARFGRDLDELESAFGAWASRELGDWHHIWRGSQWVGEELVVTPTLDWYQCLLAHNRPLAKENASLRTEVRVERGAASVYLAFVAEPITYVRIDVTAAYVEVTTMKGDTFGRLGYEWFPQPAPVNWMPLTVTVAGHVVRIECAGTELEVTVPAEFDLHGERWGLGALQNSLARFRDIEVP